MNKNRSFSRTLLVIFLLLGIVACQSGKNKQPATQPAPIDDVQVKVFGLQLERSAMDGESKFYNEAFDEKGLMQIAADNSIVKSSFDSEFGLAFFRSYINNEGAQCNAIVSQGGQYKFIRFYLENEIYHVVFRKYVDLGNMELYDYQVKMIDNRIKITDGFIYHNSATLSHDLQYTVLYHILKKTNPQGAITTLEKARQLLDNGKKEEALHILENERDAIADYPYYIDLYLRALYEYSSKTFLQRLTQLSQTNIIDKRTELLHAMLFCANQGLVEKCEENIEALIAHSGDDPIYLFFFARANFVAKNYQNALNYYNMASQNMPIFWDLWYGQLECYAMLKDRENFHKALEKSQKEFNMTPEETEEFASKNFPKMRK